MSENKKGTLFCIHGNSSSSKVFEDKMLYFCAKVKEIFSKTVCSLDFFGSFFYQEKNEHHHHEPLQTTKN